MKLIAFSGKKQSGKDSACRFLAANAKALWPKHHKQYENEFGKEYWVNNGAAVETFYVGGPMKEFAKTFGVPHEAVWGNDEDKNKPIDITWGQLPHFERLLVNIQSGQGPWVALQWEKEHRNKRLTGRQFLQQIGEEMFLPMDPDYWVKQFKASVRSSKSDVGLVADPRKPEQILAIRELGGITIRLMRDPYEGKDQHISETALDQGVYDWANFDEVIDNRGLTVAETNREVWSRLAARRLIDLSIMNLSRVTNVDFEPQHVNAA